MTRYPDHEIHFIFFFYFLNPSKWYLQNQVEANFKLCKRIVVHCKPKVAFKFKKLYHSLWNILGRVFTILILNKTKFIICEIVDICNNMRNACLIMPDETFWYTFRYEEKHMRGSSKKNATFYILILHKKTIIYWKSLKFFMYFVCK